MMQITWIVKLLFITTFVQLAASENEKADTFQENFNELDWSTKWDLVNFTKPAKVQSALVVIGKEKKWTILKRRNLDLNLKNSSLIILQFDQTLDFTPLTKEEMMEPGQFESPELRFILENKVQKLGIKIEMRSISKATHFAYQAYYNNENNENSEDFFAEKCQLLKSEKQSEFFSIDLINTTQTFTITANFLEKKIYIWLNGTCHQVLNLDGLQDSWTGDLDTLTLFVNSGGIVDKMTFDDFILTGQEDNKFLKKFDDQLENDEKFKWEKCTKKPKTMAEKLAQLSLMFQEMSELVKKK